VAVEGKTIDALSQFELSPVLGIGDAVSFSQSNLFMVIAVALTWYLMKATADRGALVPGRLQALGESAYEFIHGMVRDQVGDEGKKYFPFVFSIFMFVLFGNLLGMLPYAFTFTSHIVVTLRAGGGGVRGDHVIALAPRHALLLLLLPRGRAGLAGADHHPGRDHLLPLAPVSLSVRLFANMVAGHVMLKVFATFVVLLGGLGAVGPFVAAMPLAVNVALVGFEFLVAFLQAYVFAILTSIYLHDAVHLH
jgi:F-type H+-transporting ATPase subunit a